MRNRNASDVPQTPFSARRESQADARNFVIAVSGNPNCGKTTLFNGLTGSSQQIGNWPGVTVEKKEGILLSSASGTNTPVRVVDLPGVYNLSAFSEDERAARDFLLSAKPDLVLNVVDSTNLERNLFLTLQLLEMGLPVVVVLTMMDLSRESGLRISTEVLSDALGCPVVAVTATDSSDIQTVRESIRAWVATPVPPVSKAVCRYDERIETVVEQLASDLERATGARDRRISSRWLAVKICEQDEWALAMVARSGAINEERAREQVRVLTLDLDEAPDVLVADAKYGRIQEIVARTVQRTPSRESRDDRVDRVLMHRVWGIPIFLAVMFLVFWVTINVGGVFIPFFDQLSGTLFVGGTSYLLHLVSAPEWLITILSGGIGTGIQTVSTFIPIIFFMFLMLSLLEDSGYMARSAFVTDRFMGMIGLPGKAFVPLIVGFGCTVPAIMATRTLESRRDRILTVFMAPLMSCGARLPVYALFASAFFPAASGAVVFSLYLIGIILAVLTGLLLRRSLFHGEQTHLLMELPPYHRPRMGSVMIYTWDRLKLFIFRAGKVVILGITILSFFNSLGTDGSFGNESTGKSVLSAAGKAVTPVFAPMGIQQDNWPATVAIFSGVFAKEAVVGTLTSLYSEVDRTGRSERAVPATAATAARGGSAGFNLLSGIATAFATVPRAVSQLFSSIAQPTGTTDSAASEDSVSGSLHRHFVLGPFQAYAYLLFILIYLPCIATMGTAMREIGGGYGLVMAGYLTLVAWTVATLFYQMTVGGSILWIGVAIFFGVVVVGGFFVAGRAPHRRHDVRTHIRGA